MSSASEMWLSAENTCVPVRQADRAGPGGHAVLGRSEPFRRVERSRFGLSRHEREWTTLSLTGVNHVI